MSRQSTWNAIGISIDNHDRFFVANAQLASQVETIAQGSFDVQDPSSINVLSSEKITPLLNQGKIWSTLVAEGDHASTLLRGAFVELQKITASGAAIGRYDECVIATPRELSSSQRELVSSIAVATFGCAQSVSIVREPYAIASALGIVPSDVEESSVAIVIPSGSTYILGEEYSTLTVLEALSSPSNLDQILSKHSISTFIIARNDKTETPFGQTYGPNNIPIRYVEAEVIAHGAALVASRSAPQEPVNVLPLALGIVLHGELSHIVIPRLSVLPKRADIVLTTVHYNQRGVRIEAREGSRARAKDNLLLTELVLDGIPPAPPGAVRIEVSIIVDQYLREIVVEAVEPVSGLSARRVVECGLVMYGDGVLENRQATEEKYREEDEKLRKTANEWVLSISEQPDTAVQLVKVVSKHEEL